MPDQTAWIALTHALLFIAASAYAAFLNQDHVQAWYRPDRVEVTVIGGDVLIGIAIGVLWLLGVFGGIVPLLYTTLHIAAGLPIMAWQRQKREQRKHRLEEINRQLEERH
jgi:hypothetical protein